jgi:hypothetical protein
MAFHVGCPELWTCNKMLHPDQFDTDDDLPLFLVPTDNLWINGVDIGPVDIPVAYDQEWTPVFQLGAFARFRDFPLAEFTASFLARGSNERIELIITNWNIHSHQRVTVEAQLKLTPVRLGPLIQAHSFKAVLISSPQLLKRHIILEESDSVRFDLAPFSNRASAGCMISSESQINLRNPLEIFQNLILFMTFLKGSNCGLGNLVAINENGSVAYQLLGFTKNDSAKRQVNWFDIEVQNDISKIFNHFSNAFRDQTTRRALRQAIGFYRAANESRRVSIEMAIIAAHSSLEAIVNFVLENRAGWSNKLMQERSISFPDKLRSATAYFRLSAELLEHSPELKKISKDRNGLDAYDIVSFIRNKLVHQDTKFSPTGLQLHETWLLSQWLVEVLIFGVIGYHGKIIDRRIYSGYRGTTMLLPLHQ